MFSFVTDWARRICHQTTLTITAILISYWYLITTMTKIFKEKDGRLGAFAKPVWSHNDVFCTIQQESHAICYHIHQVSNPYQYVCQLSVYQDRSHSHSVMWCHSAWQLILTASMCHDWCQSWCLENPSPQVWWQSPLQQKQNTELHGMDRTTAQAVHRSPVKAHTWVWYQVSPCGLCGRQNSTGIVFSLSTSTFPCIIPLILHTHSSICQWHYTVCTIGSIIK
jgi:hypothetical protein